ncbi:MAG: hypothetical protein JXB50_06030 [Spirochaetes bacterium]|nr:hypothetical protein [Spirochaetota bacterium]
MNSYNFSTPSYIIYSNGRRIPSEIETKIKKIIITDNLNDVSTFKIRFNGNDFDLQRNKDIFIGTELKILTGYKDNVENILTADITGLSLDLNQRSGSNFNVIGKNILHKFTYSSDYLTYKKLSIDEIMRKLLSKKGLETRFENISFQKKIISFKYKNDLDFIKEVCDYHNYTFYVRDKIFYLKNRSFKEQEDVVLEYGKSIIDLTVDFDTAYRIAELDVKNYNFNKKKLEHKTMTINEISGINKKFNNSFKQKEVLIDKNIKDAKSADESCKNKLIKRNTKIICINGTVRGNNLIRTGSLIKFNNIQDEYSGTYLVKKAFHVISEYGYTTGFYCEK